MMVFMLLITEQIPATSDVIPLIAKFYMAVMIEMASALVVTCCVIRCYHSHTHGVPRWMKKLLVKKLANFFGLKKSKDLIKAEKEQEQLEKLKTGSAGNCSVPRSLVINGSMTAMEGAENHEINGNGLDLADDFVTEGEPPNFLKERVNSVNKIGKKILGNLKYISDSIKNTASQELVKEEWLIVANVMDRIAVWFFTIIMIITMVSIFYQAPGYVD